MNNQNHELNAGIGYNVFELACPLASFCCLAQHVKKKNPCQSDLCLDPVTGTETKMLI